VVTRRTTTRAWVAVAVVTSLVLPRVAIACVDDDDCKLGRECDDGRCVWPQRIDRYREKDPVPTGYHVEEVHRNGLLIGGGITLGLGVFIFMLGYGDHANHREDGADLVEVLGGVMILTGVGLILGGAPTHPVLIRNDVHARTQRTWGASIGLQF
jgi:hypothetical protein